MFIRNDRILWLRHCLEANDIYWIRKLIYNIPINCLEIMNWQTVTGIMNNTASKRRSSRLKYENYRFQTIWREWLFITLIVMLLISEKQFSRVTLHG